MSERDACSAAMAQGSACGGGPALAVQAQMKAAEVRSDAAATALADGTGPAGDADPAVNARLLPGIADPAVLVRRLAAWAAARERQEQAAGTATGGAKASLAGRLAQGQATAEDIEEVMHQARTGTLSGISEWLARPATDATATPQADRRPQPGSGG